MSFDDPTEAEDIGDYEDWDVALRYHEFRSHPAFRESHERLRALSARAILRRAQEVLGSVVRPTLLKRAPLDEVPADRAAELDLEETLDESPMIALRSQAPLPKDLWMSYAESRGQPVILALDTSLSMTGEKLALTAVALAVMVLAFPEDPVGIVAFENEAKVLKHPGESITVFQLVERFLDVPAKGYTHLEEGLKGALRLLKAIPKRGMARPPSTLLLTDGKYTAGKDPAYLAPRFPHLEVLKMGRESSSLTLCVDLARRGHGSMREVGELEDLPSIMYAAVKEMLRGRSVA